MRFASDNSFRGNFRTFTPARQQACRARARTAMPTETLGQRLRAQREGRQITLVAIAEQTKIKASLLDGLERDDISRWPQGIFRRAYVRSYAKAIGLDPEMVVRQFLEIYPDPIEPSPEDEEQPAGLRHLFSRFRGAEVGVSKPPPDNP